MYWRYSSSVVAPMHWSSPRARAGLNMLEASSDSAGATGADDGVELVDEEDDVLALLQLVHHRLHALFELAAVLRAGHQAGEVERHDALVEEYAATLSSG